jgi:hypothetical protein
VGDTKQSYRPLIVFLGLVVVFASFSYVLIFTAANDDDRTGGSLYSSSHRQSQRL